MNMTELTRRKLFATVAAATAAATLSPIRGGKALAAAPAAGKQAAGIYRYKIGDFEVTQIADGARTFPMPDNFVSGAAPQEAKKALTDAYMPEGKLTIMFNPMVVNTGSKLVLIDTGNGEGAFEQTKGQVGQLKGNLQAAGIDPKSIDIVLISHMHGDHINGIRNKDGSLAFPNAEIMVPAGEAAFWLDDANMSKANPYNKNYFPNPKKVFTGIENKMTKYEWGKEIIPGIHSIATPGHTPGHTSFMIQSGSGKLLVQSDVCNNPALFMDHTDWIAPFDNDPELTLKTRHKFYDMASSEKVLVAGYHFSFPAVGHVEKNGKNFRLVPVLWTPLG
jgi:glyoxylase-like metal-dependent hydrolase (beta-lactamase superfamily II)